jgi:hypothetical protein
LGVEYGAEASTVSCVREEGEPRLLRYIVALVVSVDVKAG